MAEYCTCGAQLPEDARFCHKCGKSQREELVVEAPIVETLAPPPPKPPAPSFHHPLAVRIGLLAAGIAALLFFLLPFGFVIWFPAAGFISVYLFSRRTGQSLSVRHGARMGWIAGVLSFLIFTVIFTIVVVALINSPGELEQIRQQLSAQAGGNKDLEQALLSLANPKGQAGLYIQLLVVWFVFNAAFFTAGGALGAKVLAKD